MSKNLTSQNFERLLAKLSADERQAAVAYTNLRDSLVRFFRLKGDHEPEAAADETLDRTALKVAADTPIDNVTKYSFGIARLIFLERLRGENREKSAAVGFYGARIVAPNVEESDDFQYMRDCLRRLPADERDFLQSYFADDSHDNLIVIRQRLTAENGVSINQIRVKVSRLRKRLEDCVRGRREKN